MIDWRPFTRLVSEAQSFVLTSHMRPDCDAIGSEIGLALALRALGKTARIVNGDGVVLAEPTFGHGLKHAAGILPMIDRLCREHGAGRAEGLEQGNQQQAAGGDDDRRRAPPGRGASEDFGHDRDIQASGTARKSRRRPCGGQTLKGKGLHVRSACRGGRRRMAAGRLLLVFANLRHDRFGGEQQ